MRVQFTKGIAIIAGLTAVLLFSIMILSSEQASAEAYDGENLALAMLKDGSTLIDCAYNDTDQEGHRQTAVFYSLGTMVPTNGNTFALFSTGIAGYNPVTTNQENPGDERGTWFRNKYGNPRDSATLTMVLQVPPYMHYLYYDVQFFSSEYPEFIGTKYNDELTITVNSPSRGISEFVFDVNNGYFVLDSNDVPGTGFDIFAQSGIPAMVDLVDTTPRTPGADAGASSIVPIGGTTHPVSPGEQITVTIQIEDVGDNMFDSTAFIDNMRFSGYAKTDVTARKEVDDLNGGETECNDTLRYIITISNTGSANQNNNQGNELEDYIPENTVYVPGSVYSAYGTASYDAGQNRITWNGSIPAETSRVVRFDVVVNQGLSNGIVISNQGTVYWDSDENGINDKEELTDDSYVDDGIDQDSDGETDDDDPTEITVYSYDNPAYVTEDFSDDIPGGNATQAYLSRTWFEAGANEMYGSCFEVASSYHYSTARSFKTKLRESDGPQYWYYTLSALEGTMTWWEIWFTCGDTSEEYDLYLNLQNAAGQDIAKIKFDYVKNGTLPMNWIIALSYYDPVDGWSKLDSYYFGGYLRNNWYKLRIEKNGDNYINYILSARDIGELDNQTGGKLSGSFASFTKVKWSSTTNPDPTVCPMFFWDEHKIGLTYLT